MSLNPHFPSPAPTPDNHSTPATSHIGEMDQSTVRAEVERQLLRLSQDLYEMEICAGDVGQGMEGAVPGYMAKINESFKVLSDLSGRMTESVPKQVIEKIDAYGNPHVYTKTTLTRATGENQYALGRMLGLESFRRQLHDALGSEFPEIPLPDRRHVPITQGALGDLVEDTGEGVVKEEINGVNHGEVKMEHAANGH